MAKIRQEKARTTRKEKKVGKKVVVKAKDVDISIILDVEE